MAVDFSIEEDCWGRGVTHVAGLDEVGRGCFAGPVVAGCVAFAPEVRFIVQGKNIKIDDSKKLTPKQREESSLWIKENALVWSTGMASVLEINRFGVGRATEKAFRRAINRVGVKLKAKSFRPLALDFLLIDAFYIPFVPGLAKEKQKPIVKGDGKSFTIAAASIIAKVHRDHLMIQLAKAQEFAAYSWSDNKGYGTKQHREAILKHGITKYHRKAFVETWRRKLDSRFTS